MLLVIKYKLTVSLEYVFIHQIRDISLRAEPDVKFIMAELQMQDYEELGQREDVTYDEIKTTKEKTEMNHLIVKPRNRWLKQFLLTLLISVFSAGVASTITYSTVCGK